MGRKLRVGVLFGGKSAEHEVSLLSARNVINALDRDQYDLHLIGIDKQGRWHLLDESNYLQNPDDPKRVALHLPAEEVALVPGQATAELVCLRNNTPPQPVDVVFPVLHGPYGEDGTVQGFLKLMDVPFVGAGVLGSAVCMDKEVVKRLLRYEGIPVVDWVTLRKGDSCEASAVVEAVGLPCFVKPANLGSSVGISKAKTVEELEEAVRLAFEFDTKVLIEAFIEGRELECSVLGNEEPIASAAGEVVPHHEFYSYDAKYIDEDGAALEIPARIPDDVQKRLKELAVRAYTCLECEGMARMDFFLRGDAELFVNEVNTIPGFTRISMYPKLWGASGIPYSELLDRLIQLALERGRRDSALRTSYVE